MKGKQMKRIYIPDHMFRISIAIQHGLDTVKVLPVFSSKRKAISFCKRNEERLLQIENGKIHLVKDFRKQDDTQS